WPPASFAFDALSSAARAAEPPLTITVTRSAPGTKVTAWRGVRTHGVGGELPITLIPAATAAGAGGPTVETRAGGIQKIEVLFDQPVSLADASGITITGRTTTNDLPDAPVVYHAASV